MDKAHLSASLHKLMDYLLTHGYDQPLNKKKLLSPSGRDFNNITGFLFRQLDPNYMVSRPPFQIKIFQDRGHAAGTRQRFLPPARGHACCGSSCVYVRHMNI